MISVFILILVFLLIAVRQIGSLKLGIWQAMSLGAAGVLMSGQISPLKALQAINPDVMLFLFGMFIVGQALEESGYLSHLSYLFFKRAKSLNMLVLMVMFGMGILSAFLMNDTLAIVGTPVVLSLARKANAQAKILLLTLAFAVSIGSVMSPIGNPQNLLVAIHADLANPFITFFRYLLLPTLVNLFLAYLLLRVLYRKHFHSTTPPAHSRETIKDPGLARLCRVSLALLVALVMAKIALVFAGLQVDFRLTYIALAAALPVLFSPRRLSVLRRIDWHTLAFFAAMFVVMESVWDSGFFQSAISATRLDLASNGVIIAVSVLLSQFISNVPLVALYLPLLLQLGASTKGIMALAAGSTIAGNLSILGAASNVIIIQNAEKKAGETLTFLEFIRAGVPLTAINVIVYWLFLTYFTL